MAAADSWTENEWNEIAHHVPIEDLEAALIEGAPAPLGAEAAVELLIAHGSWLARDDFRRHIDLVTDDIRVTTARIYYGDALKDDLPATASDHKILRLAAELVGRDSGIPLGDLLDDLDEHEKFLVLDAIAHALGLVSFESPA